MIELTQRQTAILRALRVKASSEDSNVLGEVIMGKLETRNIERVCELINDEYLMLGIQDDYSPNPYGKELNALLDQVNGKRL